MKKTWPRWLLWAAVCTALAVIFMAYLSPHMAVDIANRVWACF